MPRLDECPVAIKANIAFAGMPWHARIAGFKGLRELTKKMIADEKELLSMEPVAVSLSGDVANIYYQTSRTRLHDGSAVDEQFEVVHSWVHEFGQ